MLKMADSHDGIMFIFVMILMQLSGCSQSNLQNLFKRNAAATVNCETAQNFYETAFSISILILLTYTSAVSNLNGFSILDGLKSYNKFARLIVAETSAYIPLHAFLMSPILKQWQQCFKTPFSAHGTRCRGVKIPYPSQRKD